MPLREGATDLHPNLGPADAVHGIDKGIVQDDSPAAEARLDETPSAAVFDDNLDSMDPMHLWNSAIQNAWKFDKGHTSGNGTRNNGDSAPDVRAILKATTAVHSLTKNKVLGKLDVFADTASCYVLPYRHDAKFFSSFDPLYFQMLFPDLFPYYDCRGADEQRECFGNSKFKGKAWAKMLLGRSHSSRFRRHAKFIAVAFCTFLRREQMSSLAILVRQPWWRSTAERFAHIRVDELLIAAEHLGQQKSVRKLLADKNVLETVKQLSKSLEVIQKRIPYTNAHRVIFRHKFVVLRVWDGLSTFFFTLNAADVGHELTLLFASGDFLHKQ